MTIKYERLADCRCQYCKAEPFPRKVIAIFAMMTLVLIAGVWAVTR